MLFRYQYAGPGYSYQFGWAITTGCGTTGYKYGMYGPGVTKFGCGGGKTTMGGGGGGGGGGIGSPGAVIDKAKIANKLDMRRPPTSNGENASCSQPILPIFSRLCI